MASLEVSADYLPVLDPARNEASKVPLTVRDPNTPVANPPQMIHPSPYWGDEPIWTSKNNVHNPMIDARGRVWITSTVRPPDNPDVCKAGSNHPSAKLFPLARSGRQLAMYDPKTGKLTHIGTCFSTHHLMFAEDANNTLWTSGGGPVVGWLNTKMFDETGDEEKSQGWTALILDTNGNGKRDDYVEPNAPVDPGEGQAHQRRTLLRSPGARRVDLGNVVRLPGRDRTPDAWAEPARHGVGRVLRAAVQQPEGAGAGLLAARRRRRSQRRHVGGARERSHGELRSP